MPRETAKTASAAILAAMLAATPCLASCSLTDALTSLDSLPGTTAALPEVHHVAAYAEELPGNAIWGAPMEVCWAEAEEVNGGPLGGTDNASTRALNSGSFDASAVGDDHLYVYSQVVENPARTTAEINQGLSEKFRQSSEILDGSQGEPGSWFFYSMLYRKFSYATAFSDLGQAPFDGSGSFDYWGFGSSGQGRSAMASQVSVLYYDDEEHHAVSIESEDGDVVVLVRSPKGGSAMSSFSDAMAKATAYAGKRAIDDGDELAVPVLSVEADDLFPDLVGATIADENGTYEVDEARQKTRVKLDAEGGEVKSEAYMSTKATAISPGSSEPRKFKYDGEFTAFILDGNSDTNAEALASGDYAALVPYLAARVSDLSLFQ